MLSCGDSGALGGTRTPNLLIRSQMLYPLSYERRYCSILHSESMRVRARATKDAGIGDLMRTAGTLAPPSLARPAELATAAGGTMSARSRQTGEARHRHACRVARAETDTSTKRRTRKPGARMPTSRRSSRAEALSRS